MLRVDNTEIYCDGSCRPNPGRAGIGLVLYKAGGRRELWYGSYEDENTNNQAELRALHLALKLAQRELKQNPRARIQIYSDSEYSINSIVKWPYIPGRQKRTDLKNRDLIDPTINLYKQLQSSVRVKHVEAHAGTEGNELADRLANLAVNSFTKGLAVYSGSIDALLQGR